MLRWFSGLASQKWVWPSTMKISFPSGVLNIVASPSNPVDASGAPSRAARRSSHFSSDIFHDFVHIAEQDPFVVVDADHAAVVRRRFALEDLRRYLAAQIFADVI